MKYGIWKLLRLVEIGADLFADYVEDVVIPYDNTNGLPTAPNEYICYYAMATAHGWTAQHIYHYVNGAWEEKQYKIGSLVFVYDPENLLDIGRVSIGVITSTNPISIEGFSLGDIHSLQTNVDNLLTEFNNHKDASQGVHSVGSGHVVGTEGIQTIRDKTLSGKNNNIDHIPLTHTTGLINPIFYNFKNVIDNTNLEVIFHTQFTHKSSQFFSETASLEILYSLDGTQVDPIQLTYYLGRIAFNGNIFTWNTTGNVSVSGSQNLLKKITLSNVLIESSNELIYVKLQASSAPPVAIRILGIKWTWGV